MTKLQLHIGGLAVACALAGAVSTASASVIDFEDQTGPTSFSLTTPADYSTTVAGYYVTISHGSLLTHTSNLPADQTSIYGTADFCSGCVNPLTISFFDAANTSTPKAVSNLFLDVLNGNTVPVDYTLADNIGNSQTFNIVSNLSSGAATVGIAASGSVVTLSAAAPSSNACCAFDFFVDNIHFNEALPNTVPEPQTLALLLPGLIAVGALRRRAR